MEHFSEGLQLLAESRRRRHEGRWLKTICPETKREFFYNRNTMQSRWTDPEVEVREQEANPDAEMDFRTFGR